MTVEEWMGVKQEIERRDAEIERLKQELQASAARVAISLSGVLGDEPWKDEEKEEA